jgi:ribonuclease PH
LVDFVLSAFEQTKRDPLTSLATRIEVAKALVKTKTASVSDAASLIVDAGLNGRGVTVSSCREALKTLKSFGDEAGNATAKWISIVTERFPLLRDFN